MKWEKVLDEEGRGVDRARMEGHRVRDVEGRGTCVLRVPKCVYLQSVVTLVSIYE